MKMQSTHANTLLRLKADKGRSGRSEVVDLVSPEKTPRVKRQKR